MKYLKKIIFLYNFESLIYYVLYQKIIICCYHLCSKVSQAKNAEIKKPKDKTQTVESKSDENTKQDS
ncbi:hypothetical protein CHA01nite_07650 [Chryseobacterium hagamense]|uniref:Uncharacterized protein n=1 Tax=Chryseobacterium hagamense TaxID=395935 RepID=A0A511YIK1_9FLAO|nr:hypothetical protein CHA01nite_07650 [Chryseobacterium hagamense]